MHEWLPQSPDELRRQAAKLQALAAHVCRPDVAGRLEEQAAELLAQAELKCVRLEAEFHHPLSGELGN